MVRTASTHLGGKRPVPMIMLIQIITEEDRIIIVAGSPRPPGGEKTVLGASNMEKGQRTKVRSETGTCLVPVAQSREAYPLVLLALARARRKAAFGTRCLKSPEEIVIIVTDLCLSQCGIMVAREPSYVKLSW